MSKKDRKINYPQTYPHYPHLAKVDKLFQKCLHNSNFIKFLTNEKKFCKIFLYIIFCDEKEGKYLKTFKVSLG